MKKIFIIILLAAGVSFPAYSQNRYNQLQQEAQQQLERKKRAERDLYNKIVDTWKKQNYSNFLKEFPNSSFCPEIRKRLNEIELWEKAKAQDTYASYTRYLEETKYNHFSTEAREARNKAELREAREKVEKMATETNVQQNQKTKQESSKKKETASSIETVSESEKIKKPVSANSSPNKTETSTTNSKENIKKPAINKEMSREDILRHCKKGQEYYDADDISSAYNEFRDIPRKDIPLEYLEAYDATLEYKAYGNLYTKGTPEMMEEFLEKYPDSMVYDDVVQMYEDKTGKKYNSSRQVETLNFNTCRVSVIPNIRNRSMLSITMVPFEAHSSQTIRIAITINSGGEVVDAKVISGGSTAQREACLKMSLSTVWNPAGGADQEGVVTFNIQPK